MIFGSLNKKIPTSLAFVIIIILAVILVGGILVYQSSLKEEKIEVYKKKLKDETADWKTYNNPEANFIFKYPEGWKIMSEYFYETLTGIKADKITVILGKEGKEEISINLRQAQCLSPCKCEEINGNIIQTCSEKLEVLKIFNQVLSTFRFIK